MTWVAAFLAAPLCIRGSSECECEGCKNGVGNGGRKEESDWHDLSDRNICMGREREGSERFSEVCLQHKLHYANALPKFTKPQVPQRDSCLR